MIKLTDEEFADFCYFINNKYGINLSKKRILIEYRLMNVLPNYNVSSYGEYLSLLNSDKSGKMLEELINKITTNYTFFMREAIHFQFIEEQIISKANPNTPFRIWVAGCSSGQECYTLAMYLEDYRRNGKILPPIRIIASDISTKALETAREATYPIDAIDKLPEKWKQNYCIIDPNGKTFKIKDIIKSQVTFVYHNLMSPWKKNKFNLIMCRNVLIYFDESSRLKVYHYFAQSLCVNGYLILGHAEMVAQGNNDYQYLKSSIYCLKGT